MLKIISDQTFKDEVIASKRPVLVDFWAPWCGPCLAMEPTLKKLAEELDGTVDIAKLNVDENYLTAQKFGIMSIPTLILFKDGKAVQTVVGFRSKQELAALLNG